MRCQFICRALYSYYSSLYQLVASKYYFFLQLQYLFLLAYQHSASNPIGLLLSVPTGLSAFSLVSCLFTHVCSCWLTKIQPRILFVYSCLLLLAYRHSASNPLAILLLFFFSRIQPRILLLSYCCFTSIKPRILLPSQSGISIIQPTGLQPGILLAGLALYLLAGLQLAVRHPDHPLQARS